MSRIRNESVSAKAGFIRIATVFLAALAVAASTGCAARTLTITQADYINTAMGKPTGDPLRVAIVCVYPKDLKNEVNDRLRPGTGITAKEWFEREPGSSGSGRPFNISSKQVYLLTNRKDAWGIIKRGALHGADSEGSAQVKITGIKFNGWKLHSRNSVIYVFPEFIGPDLEVLPVKPAIFRPPGKYTRKLFCEIGVKKGGPDHGQYIKQTTAPGLRGVREKK